MDWNNLIQWVEKNLAIILGFLATSGGSIAVLVNFIRSKKFKFELKQRAKEILALQDSIKELSEAIIKDFTTIADVLTSELRDNTLDIANSAKKNSEDNNKLVNSINLLGSAIVAIMTAVNVPVAQKKEFYNTVKDLEFLNDSSLNVLNKDIKDSDIQNDKQKDKLQEMKKIINKGE